MTDHPSKSVERRMEAQQKHTPEPWGEPSNPVTDGYGYFYGSDGREHPRTLGSVHNKANRRRIVACVNACVLPDGTPIPAEALEGGVIGEVLALMQSFLNAWKSLGVHSEDMICDPADAPGTPKICAVCELRAALAKLKGGLSEKEYRRRLEENGPGLVEKGIKALEDKGES